MARVKFGLYSFEPATGELLRDGRPVHLQAQPAKVLAILVAARGEIVTREALRVGVWGEGTSVDFDRGLNFAIAQVRTALGDSADTPVFVRTIPKRGYQFLAPVTEETVAAVAAARARWRDGWRIGLVAALVCGVLAAAAYWRSGTAEPRLAVARFQNETGDPAHDRTADMMTDSLVASLTGQMAGRFGIIGNTAILRQPRSFQDVDRISAALGAEYVVIGQVKRNGTGTQVLAHLIRAVDNTHVHVGRQDVDGAVSESVLADRIAASFLRKLSSSGGGSR